MKRQNVTLSLPADLLLEAQHLAVERGMSLSRFLASYLETLVRNESAYEQARTRSIERMRQSIPLGVGERPGWSRDELHER